MDRSRTGERLKPTSEWVAPGQRTGGAGAVEGPAGGRTPSAVPVTGPVSGDRALLSSGTTSA